MDSHSPIATVAQALRRAERILVITGAGLSADSGMPTYRGLGGLYNGRTEEGLPIEAALSGPMLRRDPALCWKYLAELGKACLAARPNAGHEAIAELQKHKPECWVLTQNIDGFHRQAGSPAERLIEIHGELAPLYCQSCGAESGGLEEQLHGQLPPRCAACGGVLRPPVVLFEEMLPVAPAIRRSRRSPKSRPQPRAASTSNATRSLGRMLRTKGRTIHRLVRLRWRPASSSALSN